MELVGAALGDERDLRAARHALVGDGVACRDAKLLDRIGRNGQNRLESITVLGIHGDAVECDVALIAPRAIDRAAARIAVLIDVRTVAGVHHARLQGQQVRNIAALEGELLHLVFVEGHANGSIRGVQRERLCGDFHGF